jgi:DNA uptake protein ComE-like DNA-binding protein
MKIKSYFQLTKDQRSGIFLLLLLIVLVQGIYFYWSSQKSHQSNPSSQQEWLALQGVVDSLKSNQKETKRQIYPFNPNFITDYKGAQLGMSVAEIDRLLAFRKLNKYVNSAKEFQQVTQVSDSLLNSISPYFKFPDWVNQPRKSYYTNYSKNDGAKKKGAIVLKDINKATADDLMQLYGIGPALSERILKRRATLGAFVSMEQMSEVWGLSPEVIELLQLHFTISDPPAIEKIAINDLSSKELAKFPYFNYSLAKEIVIYRSMHNGIRSVEDLTKIKGMPNEKIKIIALYLEF